MAWVKKQKKMADKRAKEIEELEAKTQQEAKHYRSEDLTGLRIGHEMDLEFGDEKVLTLKDSTILENEEEGDELESLQIVAANKLQEDLDRKKQKTKYSGVDDGEFGPDGLPRKKGLLSQYDEPQERKKILIGDKGFISATNPEGEDGDHPNGGRVSLTMDSTYTFY